MDNSIQEYIIDTDIQEYIIDTDIQEYIIDTLTNISFHNDILKYRKICKYWKKYIDNQLFKFKNDDLNNYFSAMRICNKLPKDSISFKKMLIMYEFTLPNNKQIKYKCSNCGKLKLILGDYECCKEKKQFYRNSIINIINLIYIGLFYIIFINFINYAFIYLIDYSISKTLNIIDILKIIIVLV